MNNLDKLKSRSEWQAYLLMMAVTFFNHFLGLDIDADTMMQLWGGTIGYGLSRGMAKTESKREPAAAEEADLPEPPSEVDTEG